MALITSNGAWSSREKSFLFGTKQCWGTGSYKYVKFSTTGGNFLILDVNENIGGYSASGGSYGFSHMRQGGEYVSNFTGRYDGKSVDFTVLIRNCNADVTRENVAYFTNLLSVGCPVVFLEQKFLMADTRLADCEVSFTDFGREAVIKFTLVSSYPFLIDGRVFNPDFTETTAGDYAPRTADGVVAFPSVIYGTGNDAVASLDVRVNQHISTDFGGVSLLYSGQSVKNIASTAKYLWVGGNFGIFRWTATTGVPLTPFPAKNSVGYPLILPVTSVTVTPAGSANLTRFVRVYL